MKNQFYRMLCVEIFIFIFSLICLFINMKYNYFLIGLGIVAFITHKFIKTDRRDTRFQKDYLLLILIALLTYYLITYFLGFFIGFLYSTYSRRLFGIIKNLITNIIFIYFLETTRETVVKGSKYYKSCLFLSILLFALLELVGVFNFRSLTSSTVILQFILSVFIPIFLKNIMLTFLCYYSNKKNAILYQALFILPKYILGVFPDLGDYVTATFQTILPLMMMFGILKISETKRETISDGRNITRNKTIANTITTISIILIVLIVYLISGFGRFHMMAIGSGSMTGTINKGDAIIIDKKDRSYKEGEIIAFKIEGKIVVHRIIKIKKVGNELKYQTKGDYNKSEDAWELTDSHIVGSCKLRVLWIGWPSVVLSEMLR